MTSERTFSAFRRLKKKEVQWSRATWTTANWCTVANWLQTHNTLWRLLVPTNYAKGILANLSRGNCVWLSRRSAPPTPTHPPPPHPKRKEEGSIKWWWKQNINLATWNIKTPNIFKILGLTNNGAVWAWYSDLDKVWIALFWKIKILFKWALYVDDQTL